MASRQSKQTLGSPYQIYSEIANAGKNLASTKRRITWRFGWSEGDGDHEVTLVHSVVSGKKIIFEDGREIVTSSGLMQKDFTHGWNSSNYIFRVEVDGRVDHNYTFSIDGVPYLQMQRKQDVDRQKRSEDHDNDREERRGSTNNSAPKNENKKAPFSKSSAPKENLRRGSDNNEYDNRGSFQSPDNSKRENTFDPFGESNDTSDPFGEDPFGDDTSNTKKSAHNTPAPRAPVVSLLDSMNDDAAPQSGFGSFGAPNAPVFDPFGASNDPFNSPAPSNRRAADISNDFAGLSFTVAPKPVANPSNPFGDTAPVTSDEFFEEEPLPVAPVSFNSTRSASPEVWSAPQNLVNLDFNAPTASTTTNAFSGRSPSLNLLLNGSSTRPTANTGMNAPPKAPMNNNPNNGPQGMGSQGMGPQGMGMNGPMGINNGGNGGQMGSQGMNNGQMGMNGGQGGQMGGRPMMGMGMNPPQQGNGMMQQQQQGGMMQQHQGGMQGQRPMMGQGMMQQGQGMMGQNQGQGQGQQMGSGQMGGQGQMGSGMGGQQQGQGQGPQYGGGMGGGMQGQGMGAPAGNSRLMMGSSGGGMMGGSPGGLQGQAAGFSMGVNIPNTSGATSSLTGGSTARGLPSSNMPKSSLDNINWKS